MEVFKSMENIINVPIESEMKQSYLDYAMSVIVGRALPDVRDGLKPVHRRILYSMYQLNLYPDKPYKKSARIVGECLGKFHPHGDTAVYDALVRLAQTFSMRYPLVDGQGNFGSIDGDSAAAMRYTEARLSKISMELLRNIEKNTVDFRPNFDESLREPVVLPAKFPNLIVNGSTGIAVGMATNIPPHNLKEVCRAVRYLVDNEDADVMSLMKFIKGPDFPTAAHIINPENLPKIYETGRGSVTVRAKHSIEENKRTSIVINELPYQVNKAELIKRIADLVRAKKIDGISDIRDESDREGIRVVIELKRDATPEVVLNKLYKFTPLQINFNFNMIALVDGRPRLLSLKAYLKYFIAFRKEVILRRTSFELSKAESRLHILEGLRIALENIDEVVKTIKSSPNPNDAIETLMSRFKLSKVQSKAILDMKLQKLTGLERGKIESEYNGLLKDISYYKKVLSDASEQKKLIKQDMDDVIKKYGDRRKTQIVHQESEIDIESMIEEEENVVFVTHKGFVARTLANNYRMQARSGTGVRGIKTRNGDFIKDVITASSKSYLLVFTNKGRLYWLKVYEIPKTEKNSRGQSIRNFLPGMSSGESVSKVIPVKSFDMKEDVFFATRKGYVKRTKISDFSNPRSTGVNAINMDVGDKLVYVGLAMANDSVVLISRDGRAIRFKISDVREMGRAARGVRGIRLSSADDNVVAATIVHPGDRYLLIMMEKGYGKRVLIDAFPVHKRGGKGVIAAKITDKTGRVADAITLLDGEPVIVVSRKGKIIKVDSGKISIYSRNTKGVRIQRLADGDSIVSVSRVHEGGDDA